MIGVNTIIGSVASIVDKLIPDKEAAAAAKLKLLELHKQGELRELSALLEVDKAQLEVNRQEAAHKSLFVAGWRPAIGWVCASALGWQFLGYPIASFVLAIEGKPVVLPFIMTDKLFELVLAMLGMGAIRTYEKLKGISRER